MLDQKAFGLAMGLTYAAWLALLAWAAGSLRVGQSIVELYGSMFPGYQSTFLGGLVGAMYGLALGFPIGWGTAKLYNAMQERREVALPGVERLTR